MTGLYDSLCHCTEREYSHTQNTKEVKKTSKEEIKKILEKQLQLLSEVSNQRRPDVDLAEIALAMLEIARYLES